MEPDCIQCLASLVMINDQRLENQQLQRRLRKLKRKIRMLKRKLTAAKILLDEQDALLTLIVNE